MIRVFISITVIIFFVNYTFGQAGSKFHQSVKTDIILPPAAGKNVIRLFSSSTGPVAVTVNGVFRFQNGKWSGNTGYGRLLLAGADKQNDLWLVSEKQIRSERGKIIPLPAGLQDSVLCLYWENMQTLHLGTLTGMYTWTGKWNRLPQFDGIRVNDIIADAGQNLWVATNDGLWRRSGKQWINLDETLMAEGNHRNYFSLATGNKGTDIIFSSPLSVGCIAGNGEHWIWRSTDGLPYGPVTKILAGESSYWLATQKGVIHKDTAWQYYHGLRWMPAPQVNDILLLDNNRTWIATPEGISEIRQEKTSLAEKAVHYDSIIDKRHNRRGLVNISKLAVPGDITTSHQENEDNDGLWTACYLAVQCFRYAVTGEADAREKAVRTFEALERLETVTGISGYPARSYATAEDKVVQSRSPHPKHWHFSPDGKWQWLDDTSSDEITGHIYTLSLFYELVAESEQKQRVKQLVDRIVSHIVDNNFHLIDFDGKPTRWGIWHPDSLNHSPNWMYERGLNSLQILSFLKTAIHYTGKAKYEKAYRLLADKHGYVRNAVEAKVFGPFETSHSDDILNFFPYYGLFRYGMNDADSSLFVQSLERSWRHVQSDRMPVWNVIASALLGRNCDLDIALKELQEYPLDLVDWTMENSHRWDLRVDPLVDRVRRSQAVHPIPSPESSVSRWNTNPKRLDSGRRGETEETGTYYLFAYWMGRYHGFWE
ncbi:MAG: hypothetical protein KIT80_09690 [Chitinophagaceae bacterium]|nr:hypothetical protein [Chitinophagaceae bacterium]MCW5927171.1 hypothetical protein [Chitinophagaceae bacterium]